MGGSGARHRGSLGGDARRSGRGERGVRFGCGIRRFLLIGLERIEFDGFGRTKTASQTRRRHRQAHREEAEDHQGQEGRKGPGDNPGRQGRQGRDLRHDNRARDVALRLRAAGADGTDAADKGHRPPKQSTSAMGTPQKKAPAVDVRPRRAALRPPRSRRQPSPNRPDLGGSAAAQSPRRISRPCRLVRPRRLPWWPRLWSRPRCSASSRG